MANTSPGSSPADGEKGLYRSFAGIGKQFSNKLYTECKQQKSFWSLLAKKAKYVLLEDNSNTFPPDKGERNNQLSQDKEVGQPSEGKQQHNDTSLLQRRFVAMTSSLSSLGGGIGNAIEERLNKMEAKATDFMSSKRGTEYGKATNSKEQAAKFLHANPSTSNSFLNKDAFANSLKNQQPFANKPSKHVGDSDNKLRESSHEQVDLDFVPARHCYSSATLQCKEDSLLRPLAYSASDKETQLKASRDVAMAMAAKAKLLLRELKEAKADLAVAKERCTKLEEDNQMIRASISSCLKPDEEDLVRVQLETLLAEKARLAQANAYFARENQFLQEMIEFHRLTIQSGASILEESMVEAKTTKPLLDYQFQEDNELPPTVAN